MKFSVQHWLAVISFLSLFVLSYSFIETKDLVDLYTKALQKHDLENPKFSHFLKKPCIKTFEPFLKNPVHFGRITHYHFHMEKSFTDDQRFFDILKRLSQEGVFTVTKFHLVQKDRKIQTSLLGEWIVVS